MDRHARWLLGLGMGAGDQGQGVLRRAMKLDQSPRTLAIEDADQFGLSHQGLRVGAGSDFSTYEVVRDRRPLAIRKREGDLDSSVAEAIRDLHARYTDAVWRKDFAAFGECFTRDAEWRIGGLELRGRAQITDGIKAILANFRRVFITFQSPILDISEGKVSGRTYVAEQVARTDGTANISIGRYYEHFAPQDGRWRFAWRLFQLHYSGPPDMSGRFLEWDDYGAPPGMPPLDAPSGNFAAEKWNM